MPYDFSAGVQIRGWHAVRYMLPRLPTMPTVPKSPCTVLYYQKAIALILFEAYTTPYYYHISILIV